LRQKTQSAWPKSVLDLEGAWPDFPTLTELRRPRVKDARREEM
jgi:hypothetical protein